MIGFLAEKVGMTQVFDEEGNALPVTVLKVLENVVTQVKTAEGKEGYNAIQVGAREESRESRMTKAELNHCKKSEGKPYRVLKEFTIPAAEIGEFSVGDELKIEDIVGEAGSLLDVTSRPKGRGTMGRIKRHNQHRRLMTHGTKHHRQIGSSGMGTTPGRVFPGKKMPGREAQLATISHLKFFSYNPEHKLLLVVGSVPGHKESLVTVMPSKPQKGWNEYALKAGKRTVKEEVKA